MVDARLADGSRVNAVIPPLALDGPVLSIRRFRTDRLGAQDLVERQTLTAADAGLPAGCRRRPAEHHRLRRHRRRQDDDAQRAVRLHQRSERIVTIEDAAELKLRQRHVVRLETRPPNIEGQGRGAPARAGHQRAPHAPGSHHRRRGAWRRGAGHAAGDEHRPRRQPDDHPRQQPARCALSPRHDGGDGQPEHPGEGGPPAGGLRPRPRRPGDASVGRRPASRRDQRGDRAWSRTSSRCRTSSCSSSRA